MKNQRITNTELDISSIAADAKVQGTTSAGGNELSKKGVPHHVYVLTLNGTDKSYIGITCQPLKVRWRQHISAAKHKCQQHISKAIKKYGPEAFDWQHLCTCENEEDASRAEQTWIAAGWGYYNKTTGGKFNSSPSEETKAKISASLMGHTPWNKGKKLSEDHCKALSESHKGIKQSPELIEKRNGPRRGKPGKPHTEETKKLISNKIQEMLANGTKKTTKGRKIFTDDQKKRMSEQRRGKKQSAESRAKKSKAMIGKVFGPMSEAQKKQISETKKGVPRSPEAVAKSAAGLKLTNARKKLLRLFLTKVVS